MNNGNNSSSSSSSSSLEELSAPPSPSVISTGDDESTDEVTLSPSPPPSQQPQEPEAGEDEIESTPSPCPPAPPPFHHALDRLGSGGSMVLDPPEPAPAPEHQAESRKLPSSQYKGVVPQPNGRWGAQIYEKHQRVWLGTFNEEAEAARAYDVAVQRFRGRDAVTNFKPLSDASESDAAELFFLSNHSKPEIVDMLRKHTYHDELQQSRRRYQLHGGSGAAGTHHLHHLHRRGGLRLFSSSSAACSRDQLFDKAVTPSDVGKLNRLVIPKQHAEKHFPLQISGTAAASVACKGVLLNFEDAAGKVWRFRYSYWNSSQSYVLTKGWSRFVKEKSLQPGDVVSFHRSTGPDRQLFIDCKPRSAPAPVSANGTAGAGSYFLPPAAPTTVTIHRPQPPVIRSMPPVQTVRLFGVNIAKVVPAAAAAAVTGAPLGGWLEKRKPVEEMDLFPNQHCKKQCVGAAL